MAGRIPGVWLPRRKSSEHHHKYEHHPTYPRESLEEEPWIHSVSALDETAFKARQRLQKKLGHFCSSSRSSDNPKKEGKVSEGTFEKKDAGGKLLGRSSWLLLRPNKFKKERKVCAVCLEDFGQDQQVMNLSCSHKYHSACLLPWLEAHPHCPYCRTIVEPSYTCLKGMPRHWLLCCL